MRVTLSPAGRATQTARSPTAIPMLGSLVPTVIGRPRTLPERASIRVTVPSPQCATQTLPFAIARSHRWESGDRRLSQAGTHKRFLHPVVGELDLTVESMDIHTSGHLTFWAATADPGSPSESALAALSATGVAGG
jgi:hypothetical protein